MNFRGNILIVTIMLASFAFSCKNHDSTSLNLGFEMIDPNTKQPVNWTIYRLPSDRILPDSTIVHTGKYSLMIESSGKNGLKTTTTHAYRIIENIHPKKSVRLSGFIKTENVTSDSTGIAFGYASFTQDTTITLKDERLPGTHDWQEFSLEIPVDDDPDYSCVVVSLSGNGKIWVDDIKIMVDGTEILKTPQKLKFKATRNELTWLKNHYTPIKSVKAGDSFEDLQPLKEMIGNARIVGLGENTHGSSEIFRMKHRLIEFLATEMGFNIFSIEANMPEAYKLNDYVLGNEGDPKVLLKGMYFWTWNTQEILDMILWMRQFNGTGSKKIQFTGFDMQYYMGSLQIIKEYAIKSDKVLKLKTDSISSLIENLRQKGPNAIENKNEINFIREKCKNLRLYLSNNDKKTILNSDTLNYKWLLQNATVLIQCMELAERAGSEFTYRDEAMANNVKWILENNPDSKIVLWAHNGHITKHFRHMGYFLNREFGSQYYNIGFTSNTGTYTAVNSGNLNSNNILEPGIPGSFEYSFHRTGTPLFYFDFSKVKDNEPDGHWLRSKLDFRSIGAVATTKQFYPAIISQHFNAIIYIDSTKATKCFDVR